MGAQKQLQYVTTFDFDFRLLSYSLEITPRWGTSAMTPKGEPLGIAEAGFQQLIANCHSFTYLMSLEKMVLFKSAGSVHAAVAL